MIRLPPRSTRTDTLFPYTTLFRSIAALVSGSLAGAFLDVTMPEPLSKDDPLWSAPNILISMHMSGRSQSGISRKGAERFVENLRRYISGQPMISVVDLSKGY